MGAVLDEFGQVIAGQDGNGSTGIEMDRGVLNWIDTQIIRNGRERTGNRAVGHGVDIEGGGLVLDNNLIRENFQDGVELNSTGVESITLLMYRNRVQINEGRGLDVLTQDRSISFVSVLNGANLFFDVPATPVDSVFNSNVEEGHLPRPHRVDHTESDQLRLGCSGSGRQPDRR